MQNLASCFARVLLGTLSGVLPCMVVVGLLLGLVGADVNSRMARCTFGILEHHDGIGFTVIVVGLFAVAEVVSNLDSKEAREVFTRKSGSLMPTKKDIKDSFWPAVRGKRAGGGSSGHRGTVVDWV